jgi:mannosyltransferase
MPSNQHKQYTWTLENPRIAVGLLAIIVVAGITLRMNQLSARSIWFDEAATCQYVRMPFVEMVRCEAGNVHPPLHYVVLKVWRDLFGDSLLALRGLSVLFSVASILLVYKLASDLAGWEISKRQFTGGAKARWAGLVAAAMMSISIFQIRQSWEIRMYSLATLLTLLSCWLLFRALYVDERPWRAWGTYAIVTALCVYTHYATIFLIAGQAVFLIYELVRAYWNHIKVNSSESDLDRKGPFTQANQLLGHVSFSFIAGALLFAPWLPIFLRQRNMTRASWWDAPFEYSQVWNVSHRLILPVECYGYSLLFAYIVAGFIMLSFSVILFRLKTKGFFLLCVGLTPCLLLIWQSHRDMNLMIDRYFAFQQPFLLIAFALLIRAVPLSAIRNAFVGATILAGVIAYSDYMVELNIPDSPGARGVVDYLETNRDDEDLVIVANPLLYFPVLYYAEQNSDYRVYSPNGEEFPHFCGSQFTHLDQMITNHEMESQSTGRVWVVRSNGAWGSDFSFSLPNNWISEGKIVTFEDVFECPSDYTVQSYRIAPKQDDLGDPDTITNSQ